MKTRQVLQFSLDGVTLVLAPTFENLSRIEAATGVSCVTLLGRCTGDFDMKVTDLAKIVYHASRPATSGPLPDWWGVPGVGQRILDSDVKVFIALVTSFLVAALSSRSSEAPDTKPDGDTVAK